MFTGLIHYSGTVQQIKNSGTGKRLIIKSERDFINKLESGFTSVSINGSCHTVENTYAEVFEVYSGFETLQKTTFRFLKPDENVNLELPLTPTSLLDGHIVQGHIDGVGRVLSVEKKDEAALFTFEIADTLAKFLVEKDSIAIDGISLTLFNINKNHFSVAVIPESITRTTLSKKRQGDSVNIEINIFAKYAFRFNKTSNTTNDTLKKWMES